MKLSHLSETLIGSEIVKLGGEIREKIRQGERIYNFTVGDFDPSIFPIPKELEDAIVEAYRRHFTNYPAAEGNLDLRESIISFTKDTEGIDYGLSEVLVASGGRPLIYSVFRAICDKGDKVIYAVPSWNNNHYTHFVGGEHIVVEAKAENNFMPSADDIRPFIKEASLIALCSPQNPTGTIEERNEARMNFRTKPRIKRAIQEAAALSGVDDSIFTMNAAYQAALATIAAHERTRLEPVDHAAFFAALDAPPAPTEALRAAFRRHRETLGK